MARENKHKREAKRFGVPTRMADMIACGHVSPPWWCHGLDDKGLEKCHKQMELEASWVASSTAIEATNVSKFVYTTGYKRRWNLQEDIPVWVPPCPKVFVEYGVKPVGDLSHMGWKGDSPPYRVGHYVATYPSTPENLAYHEEIWQLFGRLQKSGKPFPTYTSFFSTYLQFAPGGAPMGPVLQTWYHFGERGELLCDDGFEAPFTNLLEGDWLDGGGQPLKESFPHLARYVLCFTLPAMMAFGFCHCKNTTVHAVEPDAALNRERRKGGLKPFLRYHTIDIEPMKKVLRTEGQAEAQGLKRALHICRGHFATYTEERPLFGRKAGTFWIPAHVRGSLDEGVVVSDYQVHPPEGSLP